MTAVTVAAFALLGGGVVVNAGSQYPGAALSLVGVYLYWWGTGYAEPATLTLGLVTAVAVLVLAGRLFTRYVASRVGGASRLGLAAGTAAGLVLFPFTGTTGLLLGTVVAVFAVEYRRRDAKQSLLVALGVVFGTVASRSLRVLLTGLVLVVMVVVAV
ncbi:MAG: hypothetical protein ACI9K3_000808 [Halovenus sp.]|jgi:uncharacterized protein YqgC (DUF456 family)